MSNPEFLLCDTDALIQIFIARQARLLVHLIETYGVTPTIVPEVEAEISANRKFGNRFEPALIYQLSQGHIVVLEEDEIRRLLARRSVSQSQVHQDIANLIARGQRYHRRVQRGEAYSHAAGVDLRLPLLSHDWRAVKTLEQAGEPVAVPVLRLWDLFALALDDGVVTEDDGERAIQLLETEAEFVPSALKKSAGPFPTCIRSFDSRLRRQSGGSPGSPTGPRGRLYLEPRAR